MRSPVALVVALLLVVGSIVALATASKSSGDAVHPAPFELQYEEGMRRTVAETAMGRRVLWIDAGAPGGATAQLLESGRLGGVWALYEAAPPDAPEFARHLSRVAAAAAADFDGTGSLGGDTLTALERLDVSVVVAHDEREWRAVTSSAEAGRVEQLGRGLRLRRAEPCIRLQSPEAARAALDMAGPIAWSAGLAVEPATVKDLDLLSLWGASLTVEAATPGTYLLALPADGAMVSIDGNALDGTATGAAALGPFLALDLAAGSHAIDVAYREVDPREWLAVAGAVGLVLGLVLLLVALRSRVLAAQRLADEAEREIEALAPTDEDDDPDRRGA